MQAFLDRHRLLLLCCTLILAGVVRFFQLGAMPPELNRDEASLGYTAYALLKTGREEHGVPWPIQIESFGDWKLPGYVYTLIPFIQVFGLTAWSIRLPSALAGLSIVLASFFLVRLLFSEKKQHAQRTWLQFFVPISIAVSPWAIHFSHVAYEAHLAMALFIWGLVAVLSAFQGESKDTPQKTNTARLLFLASVLWSATLLTYHSYQVFIPLFCGGVVYVYRQRWPQIFSQKKALLAGVLLPFVLAGSLLLASGVFSANTTKFSGLSIFDLDVYSQRAKEDRMAVDNPNNPFFVAAANKFEAFGEQVQNNVFQLLSPEFLFLSGGENHSHNVTGFGNMHPLLFFGLVAGIFMSIMGRKWWQVILLGWVGAASVAPLITFESNHTTRFSPAFVALEILSAYGWWGIVRYTAKSFSRKTATALALVLLIGLSYSAYRFFVYYNFILVRTDAPYWSWQMKPLVYFLESIQDQYDAIYIQGERSSPYIYFLVHGAVDPSQLSERLEYYPVDKEGFRHVRRLDTLYFQDVPWHERKAYEGKNVLFVVEEHQIPAFNQSLPQMTLLTTLKQEWAEKGIEVWEFRGREGE